MDINRRQMIQAIGAAIILGLSPKFVPSLIASESNDVWEDGEIGFGTFLSGRPKDHYYRLWSHDAFSTKKLIMEYDDQSRKLIYIGE